MEFLDKHPLLKGMDRMFKKSALFSFSVVLFLTLFIDSKEKILAATTFTVPQQYSTIQAAIDASSTGDVIMVSPGSYAGFELSKQITISAVSYNHSAEQGPESAGRLRHCSKARGLL